jgi:isopentenyl-diphosphate delta-isomerase
MSTDRKLDHIQMALSSQVSNEKLNKRFDYEPLLKGNQLEKNWQVSLLGKSMLFPLWISSMTGGAKEAKEININLAKGAKEFGIGLGLGSCRSLLSSDQRIEDFQVRRYCEDSVLMANLGIAQIEQLWKTNKLEKISELIKTLDADGIFIHINPLQELFQPEGDTYNHTPLDLIARVCELDINVAVKEVGQGMGPRSIAKLSQLPIKIFETAAFGGTNFSILENRRNNIEQTSLDDSLCFVGQSNDEMLVELNRLEKSFETVIFSGGIQSPLDGYYYLRSYREKSLYGLASRILPHARKSYELVQSFLNIETATLMTAKQFLALKGP